MNESKLVVLDRLLLLVISAVTLFPLIPYALVD
jgi:hypothetical protein